MVQKKVKVKLGNETLEGVPVSVSSASEQWNEYLLEDNTVVRMKLVVTDVVKVDERYDQDGNPLYIMKSSNIASVSSPDKLKRPE